MLSHMLTRELSGQIPQLNATCVPIAPIKEPTHLTALLTVRFTRVGVEGQRTIIGLIPEKGDTCLLGAGKHRKTSPLSLKTLNH